MEKYIYVSPCLQELADRNLIDNISDPEGLDAKMMEGPITAYLGIDCTGNDLHIGHYLPILVARILVLYGHKVIIVLGNATAAIGDPSGKDKTRPELSPSDIEENYTALLYKIDNLFRSCDMCRPGHAIENLRFIGNDKWLDKLSYIDFLRDYGKYFSVSDMLSLDSVKDCLDRELPMNFTEFNYCLLQAYDFLELNKRYDCILQIGGSDQWGNISKGISLGNRFDKELFGMTTPLLLTKNGKKMGKTEGGAVSLYESSPYEMGMFFLNMPDDLARKWFLYLFGKEGQCFNENHEGDISITKINVAKMVIMETREERDAKINVGKGYRIYDVHSGEYFHNTRVCDIMFDAGMAASVGEAKRLIKQGAVNILDKDFAIKYHLRDPLYTLKDCWDNNEAGDFKVMLQAGKKICEISSKWY